MNAELERAVGDALGAPVTSARGVGGGDINDAYRVRLADGRDIFVKANGRAPAGMFSAEARGLAWLDEAGAIRLPGVLAVADQAPAFLALEHLEPGRRARDFDERLGRELAALHAAHPERFGLDHDNFIGRLPQDNAPADDWPTFYAERRLRPQLERAAAAGYVEPPLRRAFDTLFQRLPDLVGSAEPPARLHGDLWAGNLHTDPNGHPCLIDPAAYAGHREIDLAMMQLFGGFGPRVFAAYDEAHPLDPSWPDRTALYQLYPLMVHLNHFGCSYLPGITRALRTYV